MSVLDFIKNILERVFASPITIHIKLRSAKMKNKFSKWFSIPLISCLILNSSLSVFADNNENALKEFEVVPSSNADASSISPNLENPNGIVEGEIVSQRTENSKVFYKGNNEYTKKIYFEPIHIENSNETFSEISSNLKTNTSENVVETKNTELHTSFEKKVNQGHYATVSYASHQLKLFAVEASKNGEDAIPAASVIPSYKTDSNHIIHKNIFPDIDLRNFTFNENIKEDIIINTNNGINKFKFKIETDLVARTVKDGSIEFLDDNTNTIFTLPKPYMTDSNYNLESGEPQKSENVKFEVEKVENGYLLDVTADLEWLNSKDRVYPVYLDPTTSVSVSSDTYISNAYPSTNYSSASSKWDENLDKFILRAGYYSSSTGTNYTYLVNPISSFYGLDVTSAKLKVYVAHHYYPNSPNGLWLDRNNGPINVNSLTWSTRPTSTNVSFASVGRQQWATFDITPTAQGWAKGEIPNYGLKLHTNGNGQEYWKKIVSSDNPTYKPYLEVDYSLPAPVSKAYGFADGTGYVNLTWKKLPDAVGYKVWIYNGLEYESFNVGNTTTWSTKGKNIWPTTATGYKLNHSGGQKEGYGELVTDPSQVYKNSGGNYPSAKHYWFRVSAIFDSGAESNMSPPSNPTILKVPASPIGVMYSSASNSTDGHVDLKWNAVENATGYMVWMFNGAKYESFDVGNTLSWNSKNRGVWPTASEIAYAIPEAPIFHLGGSGTELAKLPSTLYKQMGANYASDNNYYFKVSAYNTYGTSGLSSTFSTSMSNDVSPETSVSTLPTEVVELIDSNITLENNQFTLPDNIYDQLTPEQQGEVSNLIETTNEDILLLADDTTVKQENNTIVQTVEENPDSPEISEDGTVMTTMSTRSPYIKVTYTWYGSQIYFSHRAVDNLNDFFFYTGFAQSMGAGPAVSKFLLKNGIRVSSKVLFPITVYGGGVAWAMSKIDRGQGVYLKCYLYIPCRIVAK